jgi:feruloyl-CoA synthase
MSVISLAPDPQALGLRDPRYAHRRLIAERRDDGAIILANPASAGSNAFTTLDALEFWAEAEPEAPWLAERSGEGWRIVAYGEGLERVRALAGGLADVGAGGPLLILARNGVDHALLAFAAMSRSIPVAAISPQYGLAGADLSRLAHAVELIGPGAVLVDDAAAFSEALGSDILADLPVIAMSNLRPGDIGLTDLLASRPAASTARPDDIAKLLLTSGSTGKPKAVICLHRGVAVNAAQVAACYDDPEPPVVVNQAPWSHSLGANAILQMVRNLEEIAPTYHNMVPAGWDLLAGELETNAALAKRFFSRVRVLQYGGAALGQSTCERIQAVARATVGEGITFASGYGATETGPTVTTVHWPNLTMGLMGLPTPETTVKLTPMDDRLEFRVKGPQVSPGYYRNEAATAAAFDEEGFYRLGDAARPVDPARLELGLVFDGRLSENFKLSSGVFVNAGALRVAALSAIGGAAADAVVCGEGHAGIGLMIFLNRPFCRSLGGDDEPLTHAAVRDAVRTGLERLNRSAPSPSSRVARALILADDPHAHSGEVTDKGYINQTLARRRRADDIARLFAQTPDAGVRMF